MWGALVFLAFFLVIAPSSRDVILAMLEQARLRIAMEAPLSYFLVVVLGGSALVSALIMRFWPRVQDNAPPVRVVRHYQGRPEDERIRVPRPPAFGVRLLLDLVWVLLPAQARRACQRLLGHPSASVRLKRLPGA